MCFIYFYVGHSRTVVGVEKLSDGTILLLVLDPSSHYDKLRTESGMTTMSHIRKSLNTFKAKQYQLVTVVGIMTSDAEFEVSIKCLYQKYLENFKSIDLCSLLGSYLATY